MDRILLVTRNQSKHPDRGCAKASHDGRISGRGEFNRASPKKMCEKFWTLSANGGFLGKYLRQEMAQNSKETNLSAILGRSHPGCTPSSSLLQYREIRNHKSEKLFQVTKNPAGEKIAEEPAESLARHQNCQFRENVRGTNFKGSQLFKLLQTQKKEVRRAQRFTDFSFRLVPKGRLELPCRCQH